MMKSRYIRAALLALAIVVTSAIGFRASAQHTLTLMGGTGSSYARFYPAEETKWLWGAESYGVAWRYYSDKPRFVGAVGVDLEYMERGYAYGYSYVPTFVGDKEIRNYQFYERRYKSLMLPLVWQPHFYLLKNRLRLYVEAAFVLSYNFSSDYRYDRDRYPAGKYEWKVPRDNRFGYGLMGGVGFAVLIKQLEVGFKARYNFGYSDILKNRNKYYSNTTDGRENPFYYTPLRSPVDNLTFSITVGWRFNKRGFNEWFVERPQRTQRLESFNFSQATNAANGGRGTAAGGRSGMNSSSGNRSGNGATSSTRPGGGASGNTRPGGGMNSMGGATTKPTGGATTKPINGATTKPKDGATTRPL